ncbi:hypothetical protein CBL_08741 [Carabus blaptoides fortunei]
MMIIKILLSVIGIIFGYAGFFVFLILQNYQAAVWAFFTGLMSSILLQIHWLKYRNRISEYYTAHSLWSLAWIGLSIFIIGFSAFIFNFITYCALLPPILPVNTSIIISIVWCFLTFKTGIVLFWYARKYAHFVHGERAHLLETNQRRQPVSA